MVAPYDLLQHHEATIPCSFLGADDPKNIPI